MRIGRVVRYPRGVGGIEKDVQQTESLRIWSVKSVNALGNLQAKNGTIFLQMVAALYHVCSMSIMPPGDQASVAKY